MTGSNLSRRNCNIDFIKVIACIAVVGLHTFPKDLSTTAASLYYLCGFAVPMFFMSSGYFLLNRGGVSYKYAVRKCIGIIRVVFFWNTLIFFLKYIKQVISGNGVAIHLLTFVKEFIKSFVQKGTLWQFWYLGALLIIYAILPILSKISCRKKKILILICGVVSIAFEIGSLLYGKPLQKYVIQTFRLWTWLFYFLIGSEMPNAKKWFSEHIKETVHLGICIFITVLIITYQNNVGSRLILETTGILHAEYFYDSFFEMIWIVWVFTFMLRCSFIGGRISDYILRIAPLTMGIYIIHPIIRNIILTLIRNTSVFRSLVYWGVTLFGATIITWIISKLPIGKYLVKI